MVKRFVLAWVATALAATGAAVAVLGLLGGGLTGPSGRVLSQDEVRAELATASAAAPRTPSTPAASPYAGKVIRTAGGTVIASCAAGQVTLRSWSPAQGYSVDDDILPGPSPEAMVEFDADAEEGEDVEVRIGCSGGEPVTLPR